MASKVITVEEELDCGTPRLRLSHNSFPSESLGHPREPHAIWLHPLALSFRDLSCCRSLGSALASVLSFTGTAQAIPAAWESLSHLYGCPLTPRWSLLKSEPPLTAQSTFLSLCWHLVISYALSLFLIYLSIYLSTLFSLDVCKLWEGRGYWVSSSLLNPQH